MAVDDPCERVGEVGVRIDAAELAGLDQRGDDRPIVAAAIRAGEERILAIERDGPDRSLDRVGVDLDPAVVEEANETVPMREPVADRLSELALLAHKGELFAQPWFEFGEKRTRSFLANGASLVWSAAADVALDPIERGDALQRRVGDRGGFGDGAFVAELHPLDGRLRIFRHAKH
jgi:hypothetical protein